METIREGGSMSLRSRVQEKKTQKPKFILVAGPRFGGKTGALGTLPGKTLVIEITDKESGSDGAVAVAEASGNTLDVVTGNDCDDVLALAKEAFAEGYDNVAVDGISALTEVEADKPKVKKHLQGTGNAVFVGWRMIGDSITQLIQDLKSLSLEVNKPIVLTLALKENKDREGNVTSTDVDTKGNMAESFIRGKCKFYLVARMAADKDGNPLYVLQTGDDGIYGARLDGVLSEDNPKGFRTQVSKLEEGQKAGLAAVLDFLGNYWNKGE